MTAGVEGGGGGRHVDSSVFSDGFEWVKRWVQEICYTFPHHFQTDSYILKPLKDSIQDFQTHT